MKKYMLLLMGCFWICYGQAVCYEQDAIIWSQAVINESLSEEEQTLFLNLLYWSAERSRMVVVMQEATTEYLKYVASIVQDTMSARLNPARLSSILNYSTEVWQQKMADMQQAEHGFSQQTRYYRYVCATYAQCIEYLLKTNILRSELDQHIRSLRKNARIIRMQKCKDTLVSLQSWMEAIQRLMSESNNFSKNSADGFLRGISDYIIDFTQPALLRSFVSFDKRYNRFNEHAWKTLVMSYVVGNLIWKVFEDVRFEFYAVHYTTLQNLLHVKDDFVCLIAFNEDGFIIPEERLDVLSFGVL